MKSNNTSNKSKKATNDKTDIYVLKDQVLVNQIETVKKNLLSLIDKSNTIQIVGDNIKNIDITFIQILLALKKSAKIKNKQINFNLNLSEDIVVLLENNGFIEFNKNLNI